MKKDPAVAWGARTIGETINRSERQTHYLLEQGLIQAARKVGSQWYAPISGLHEQFCGDSGSDTERANGSTLVPAANSPPKPAPGPRRKRTDRGRRGR
jgi:hypothetical protein